ncbi:hypothetical protein FB451DRAFT_475899 [Mycena latifolia]|nr:hypothetical protein FB451DRAFT_475899 [Mycena latifolia]
MHPCTRQPSLGSVLSWWSDSNPPGPTISLHAAAKPLMRAMYHRQALAFIKKNSGIPLSKETLEIYSSYLAILRFKYVSPETKAAILRDLPARERSTSKFIAPEDARPMMNSPILHSVEKLFRSRGIYLRFSKLFERFRCWNASFEQFSNAMFEPCSNGV